jgi:hypothetical protein
VKQALAGLGPDAMPVQPRRETSLISNYKSNLLKKGGEKKAGARKKGGVQQYRRRRAQPAASVSQTSVPLSSW